MRMHLCGILILVVSAGPVAAQTSQPGSAAAPTPGGKAAADSFRHSAVDTILGSDGQTQARRLVALCGMAHRLAPDHPLTNLMLATEIYPNQRKHDQAVKACETYLKTYPANYTMGLMWLAFAEKTFKTVDEKVPWMESAAQQSHLGAPVRAEALARQAATMVKRGGTGHVAKAETVIARALRLDPYNTMALQVQLNLRSGTAPPSKADQATYLMALLKASGGYPEYAGNLAMLLQTIGLNEGSLIFYKHLWDMGLRRSPDRRVPYNLVVGYANALLDAGRPTEAIKLIKPQLKRRKFKFSVDLHSLAAEAFLALNQPGLAQAQITEIENVFKPFVRPGKPVPPKAAKQLAMFYVMSRPESGEAMKYAQIAAKADPRDQLAQRLLGAAEVASGDKTLQKSGRERLIPLLETDLYAVAALAKHYSVIGEYENCRKTILGTGTLGHQGPAFRKLKALAKKRNVAIPPVKGRDNAAVQLQTLDKRILEMGSSPEKFLAVAIEPTRRKYVPGEPIEVDVVFRNIGPIVMPLGQVGVCMAIVRLTVADDVNKENFDNLPLAMLPAPRYLPAGKSVRTRVRLDVGKLAASLAKDPLTERVLTIAGQVDPRKIRGGTTLISTVPTVKISPVTITRVDLLGQFARDDATAWPKQYDRALGLITRDILKGSLPQRMHAARQVGALLTLARAIERGVHEPPTELAGRVTKPVLLRMLQEVLKDREAAVRAEMIAALSHVSMDKRVLQQLGQAGVIGDPSPLVRMRVAEMFGANPSRGSGKIVRFLMDDRDELVAMMAKAFGS